MFAPIPLHNAGVNILGEDTAILPEARRLFGGALTAGNLQRAKAALTRRSRRLLVLADQSQLSGNRRARGVQTVALDAIRGTLNKADSFDYDFYPLRKDMMNRWAGVAGALLRGLPLPPVELVLVGETYYVVDGHHRISVARAFGQTAIEAVVTEWETA